jgi:hypothetical protein
MSIRHYWQLLMRMKGIASNVDHEAQALKALATQIKEDNIKIVTNDIVKGFER